MLCEEELVASIRDKIPDFSIHVSDLKSPTAKFVQSYYVRVLEEVGVDVDELQEPSAENLHELDYPDAYRCVLPLAKLHAALCFVFKNIYVDDFSVLDLTEPSQRRTKLLIKAMDSFHSFADWKAQGVQDGIEKLQKRKADFDRLRSERQNMKMKLNTCAIERVQRQEYKKQMETSCEETKRRFIQLQEEDGKLQEQITTMEAKTEQHKEKHRQRESELEKLEEEASKLRGQIVTLPAYSEADLNRMREKKQEVKAEKLKVLELKKEKNRQKELNENVVHWQEKCEAKLKDVGDLCERLKKCDKKKQKSQETTQASLTEMQEIERKTRKMCAKVTELQEEKMAASIQWEKEKAAMIESIKQAKSEMDQLEKEEDDLAQVMAKRREAEEQNELLSQLREDKNKQYNTSYQEKIAKQDANIQIMQDTQRQLLEKLKKLHMGD